MTSLLRLVVEDRDVRFKAHLKERDGDDVPDGYDPSGLPYVLPEGPCGDELAYGPAQLPPHVLGERQVLLGERIIEP